MVNKKIIQTMALVGLIGTNVIAGEANDKSETVTQKPTVVLTRVQNKKADPINRIEAFGKLPYEFNYHGIAQSQGDVDFRQLSLSYVPLNQGPFGLGATIQHKNSNVFSEQNDYGALARIQGSPLDGIFGKLDLKYLPERNNFEWYGFFDSEKVFLDLVGSYNHETDGTFLQPGIDFKINDMFSLGLEGTFTGEISELNEKYIGVRAKIQF